MIVKTRLALAADGETHQDTHGKPKQIKKLRSRVLGFAMLQDRLDHDLLIAMACHGAFILPALWLRTLC